MANAAYLWIIPYSQHCFLWNFVFYSRDAYLTHQYKKMLYRTYSYRITIDQNPIPQQQICVLSYICLLLTKVLFQTSFKSFQYNIEGRGLSNYSIKLILCSHHYSSFKGLCQNKKHEFDQYTTNTKGCHFCAAHMALCLTFSVYRMSSIRSRGRWPSCCVDWVPPRSRRIVQCWDVAAPSASQPPLGTSVAHSCSTSCPANIKVPLHLISDSWQKPEEKSVTTDRHRAKWSQFAILLCRRHKRVYFYRQCYMFSWTMNLNYM